jgi:hypothetical protein
MEKKHLPNIGYIVDDVPKDILATLAKEIDYIRDNPTLEKDYTSRVSSSFKEAYELVDSIPILENYLIKLAKEYDNEWPSYSFWRGASIGDRVPVRLNDLWVNIQTPGTFNPNHKHPALFSFVIWLHIPYKYSEQQKDQVGTPLKGCFEFTYNTILGEVMHHEIKADSTHHGKICFFPSMLTHCVYPFTGTPGMERISVSGNLSPSMIK